MNKPWKKPATVKRLTKQLRETSNKSSLTTFAKFAAFQSEADRLLVKLEEEGNAAKEAKEEIDSLKSKLEEAKHKLNSLCHHNNGAGRIAQERVRQVVQEGFTQESDKKYTSGELAIAAACYAVEGTGAKVTMTQHAAADLQEAVCFPWGKLDKRKKHSYMRRLEIAGALIAAELDRIINNPDGQQSQS